MPQYWERKMDQQFTLVGDQEGIWDLLKLVVT